MTATFVTSSSGPTPANHTGNSNDLHSHSFDRALLRTILAETLGTFVLVLTIVSGAVAATLAKPIAGVSYGSSTIPVAGGVALAVLVAIPRTDLRRPPQSGHHARSRSQSKVPACPRARLRAVATRRCDRSRTDRLVVLRIESADSRGISERHNPRPESMPGELLVPRQSGRSSWSGSSSPFAHERRRVWQRSQSVLRSPRQS